jgi:hypothetical protein
MRIAQIAPLTEAVPPQLYGVPNDIVLLRNRGQLFGWVNAPESPTRRDGVHLSRAMRNHPH